MTRYVLPLRVLTIEIGEGLVMLDSESDTFCHVNVTGRMIVELLESALAVDEIVEVLVEVTDGELVEIRAGVEDIVVRLSTDGFLEAVNDEQSSDV